VRREGTYGIHLGSRSIGRASHGHRPDPLRIAPAGLGLTVATRPRIRLVIGVLLLAHMAEIGLYAAAFYVCQNHLQLGVIAGDLQYGVWDLLYFSISTYTTLGFGDLYPQGPLRLIAGIESLNGLVLIGWSTSSRT
jgi:hypothetical protein